MIDVTLILNGEKVVDRIEDRCTLADFLRNQQGLTGTHLACEHGVCGACTVLMDEKPIRSCITFAGSADGVHIRTVEGFENDELMALIRQSFSEEHALQCGFCTPGMLIMVRDIIMRGMTKSETEIRTMLAGNLCRCTGYAGIVRAVMAAEKKWRSVKAQPLDAVAQLQV